MYRSSYDFPISDAHFVPRARLADVMAKLQEFKTEFNGLVDKFVENYEDYKEKILADPAYADIVETLRPLYPSKEAVRSKFGFSVNIFELAMPKAFEETDIQALIGRDEAKEEVKTALKEQLKEQHENSVRLLEKFTEDAATSLRAKLVTMCKTIIEKIQNKELISKANINTIREEIANFRGLNFLDDKSVETEIAKLEMLVEGDKNNFKTDRETIDTLNETLGAVLAKAENLSDISKLRGQYFRKIKV